MFRTALIHLRYFWPIVPGVAAVVFSAWVLWDLGFWVSVFLPLATGVAVSFAVSMVGMAAGVASRH